MQRLFRGWIYREFARISNAGIIRRWWRLINLQSRTALCVDCTNGRVAFLGSPFPQLLPHMWFALVQLLFWSRVCREFERSSIPCFILRWCRRINLQARTALFVDCTNGRFAFLGSPFPQLLSHMLFALVQLLFWSRVCREFERTSIAGFIRRWWRRINLQARTALCVDCTNGWFAFFGLPIPTASSSYVVCISATIVLE